MVCGCRKVNTLRVLCLKTFQNSLVALFNKFLKSASVSFADCVDQFHEMMTQARDAPESLHDEIVHYLLGAALVLLADFRINGSMAISKEPSAKHQLVIQQLISVVPLLKPKKISLFLIKGSDLIDSSFHEILSRMTKIESFRCWPLAKLTAAKERFLENCPTSLINLTYFSCTDCSDEILATICKCCTLIQVISVGGEMNVTNDCILSLVRCKNLRKVDLRGTSVTAEGYVQLLLDTQSEILTSIREFEANTLIKILDLLEAIPFRTFNLKNFGYYLDALVPDTSFFPRLVKFFPELARLELVFHFYNLPNSFAVLDQLKSVTEAKLDIIVFKEDHFPLENFLSLKCSLLTCLSVIYRNEPCIRIKATDLINIGLNCPNLETLLITMFYFSDYVNQVAFDQLSTKPFLKLKELRFHASGASLFKLILHHTFNIESISIEGKGSLTDNFFTDIFNHNPLERLKILSIETENEISARILKLIINNCTRLSRLGCIKKCVALSQKDRQEISLMAAQRYDLKLR